MDVRLLGPYRDRRRRPPAAPISDSPLIPVAHPPGCPLAHPPPPRRSYGHGHRHSALHRGRSPPVRRPPPPLRSHPRRALREPRAPRLASTPRLGAQSHLLRVLRRQSHWRRHPRPLRGGVLRRQRRPTRPARRPRHPAVPAHARAPSRPTRARHRDHFLLEQTHRPPPKAAALLGRGSPGILGGRSELETAGAVAPGERLG